MHYIVFEHLLTTRRYSPSLLKPRLRTCTGFSTFLFRFNGVAYQAEFQIVTILY